MMLPFRAALGEAIDSAAPSVREHFLQPCGTRHYRGVMRRVWRRRGWQGLAAAPFLWLGSWKESLFASTGADVPFELENRITALPDGRAAMTWLRTFHFPSGTRRFSAVMVYEPGRRSIVDLIGKRQQLEVELHPRVEAGTMVIRSGRQRLRLGPLRVPIPVWFAGRAEIHEWAEPDGSMGVRVTIHNPLLGEFFGYEGFFRQESAADERR